MAYTEPRIWITGEQASAPKLNEVMDNIRALKTPPAAVGTIRSAAANITTALTTLSTIDPQFNLSIETTGGALRFDFTGIVSHSVAATLVLFDVLIDGTTYLSSMSGTPVTNNLWHAKSPTISVLYPFTGTHVLPAGTLDAGIHTFNLMWRGGAAGTSTLGLIGYVAQFSVSE